MERPLTEMQKEILAYLEAGREIGDYPTGNNYGYSSYYRWKDTLEVIPSRTIRSMKRKGITIDIPRMTQIVKYNQ